MACALLKTTKPLSATSLKFCRGLIPAAPPSSSGRSPILFPMASLRRSEQNQKKAANPPPSPTRWHKMLTRT
ncbi:hypothetical protein VTK26DRAFT_3103 [Humicola hyalothermophila]